MDTICHGADTHLLSSFEGDDDGKQIDSKLIVHQERWIMPNL